MLLKRWKKICGNLQELNSKNKVIVVSNKYIRYLALKRHVKFVWNCANGQVNLKEIYGKLTKEDYPTHCTTNWGNSKRRCKT